MIDPMTASFASTPAYPVQRRGVRTVPLRGSRWRVTRDAGEVLGYVELVEAAPVAGAPTAPRWRSSRMPSRQARFLPLGEFASAADALDAVRLS